MRLEKAVSELKSVQKLLLSDRLDAGILEEFRDTLNRTRNIAWVAKQYMTRSSVGDNVNDMPALLAGERIRAAFQLCRALTEDLQREGIDVPVGTMVQLHDAARALVTTLKKSIRSRE
jgi:hypothetical protein